MIHVTAGVIRKDDRVLIARRPPGDALEGLWEFPGGKIEKGESSETCLARELHEELGIVVRVGRHLGSNTHAYPDKTVELLFFEVALVEGTPHPHEHDCMAWVTIPELSQYTFAPADVPFVEELLRRALPATQGPGVPPLNLSP